MPHPNLTFCPYLSLNEMMEFSGWRIAPLDAFDGEWADRRFESQAKAFLQKFVNTAGDPIERPTIMCRADTKLDGQPPTPHEIQALQAAISFAFLDTNPRPTSAGRHRGWSMVTSDNTEIYVWPIDVESGHVVTSTGLMVRVLGGGYQVSDPELVIRPPLDLHAVDVGHWADKDLLNAVYKTVLSSLQSPGVSTTSDRLRVAIGWLEKAWRNTATVGFPERIVFLKTAFEAITGTSKSYKSAPLLRALFEGLPDTSVSDSDELFWSPEEKPIHTRTYNKGGHVCIQQVTDLELWFMSLAEVRNSIIHEGIVPSLTYDGPAERYRGSYVFTAEYLLRAVIKASLPALGFPDLWRSSAWRAVKRAAERIAAESG